MQCAKIVRNAFKAYLKGRQSTDVAPLFVSDDAVASYARIKRDSTNGSLKYSD